MKMFDINCTIEMTSSVNSSEDPDKVKHAISNIFPDSVMGSENFSIIAKSYNVKSLEKIHEAIHSKQVQKTYKRNLVNNLDANTTWFYLNKQAAFVSKIVICSEFDESPLGPIKVIITSSNIDKLINWLTSN